MTPFIPSVDLRPAHLPAEDDNWRGFSVGFDGYLFWGSFERCAEVANGTMKHFLDSGLLTPDLDVLRTCVFFERRRERHGGFPPDETTLRYLNAVVRAIRREVALRS